MAIADLDVRARRTALLLRSQRARERHSRHELARAENQSLAVAEAERAAAEAENAGRIANVARLRDSFGALGGRVMASSSLSALPALKQSLDREEAEWASRTQASGEKARVASQRVAEARAQLSRESRVTERRSKLAGRTETLVRRAAEAAEESERDDQVADTWR